MNDPEDPNRRTPEEASKKFRGLVGQWDHAVYQLVKAGRTEELSREGQLYAKAIQEHLHLPHIHNALEFADVREGEPYLVDGVNLSAHLTMHAAVEGQAEEDGDVKAALEKLLAAGIDKHHAVHILGMIFLQYYWEAGKAAERGEDLSQPNKYTRRYKTELRKICTDSAFRRKWIRTASADHPWAERD